MIRLIGIVALRAILLTLLTATALANPSRNIPAPGGMWMPSQIEAHAGLLKQLGLELDPKDLSNLNSPVLKAIISLGGCSGSFISKSGLIITNHHCVQRILSYLSQQDRERGIKSDYVKDGFLAKATAEERSAGPSQKVFVTTTIEEVTDTILAGIEGVADPIERTKLIEQRVKDVTKAREAGRPDMRVDVVPFYRGARYFAVDKLEIRDVRIVYAPPGGVGFFGGDTDNWHWPRHTGDFALLRAYVAPDGSSKPLDPANVPYQNQSHLKLSRTGVAPYDLVMVAGYPGSTQRLTTAEEVRADIEQWIPKGLDFWKSYKALLEQLAKTSEDVRIKTESMRFSLANVIKNRESALRALGEIQYVELKTAFQAELAAWLAADADRAARFGTVLKEMDELRIRGEAISQNLATPRLTSYASLIGSAVTIARLADERAKPDAERDPAYQERNWPRFEQAERSAQSSFDVRVQIAAAEFVLNYTLERDGTEALSPALADLIKDGKADVARLTELYQKTALSNLDQRLDLLKNATLESLAKSTDPLVQLALKLLPETQETQEKSKAFAGEKLLVTRKYIAALEEFMAAKGTALAPDANSTLRLTFGQVKGYTSPRTGKEHKPFTHILDVLRKHKLNDPEFEVPFNVQKAIDRGDFAPYADPYFGLVPVNFLAGVDTTGGNSGSAAINGRGELVGLLFDGNEDALFSDWHYDDAKVRSILLDIRYFLWNLDKVERAEHLLKEMDVLDCSASLGDRRKP